MLFSQADRSSSWFEQYFKALSSTFVAQHSMGFLWYTTRDSNKMAASHEGVVRAACSSCQQISNNEQFIACPLSKTTVGVWWIPNLSKNVGYFGLIFVFLAYFVWMTDFAALHDLWMLWYSRHYNLMATHFINFLQKYKALNFLF